MPSLDIKSEIDSHELLNAIDQANRVISNRFDFKGTDSKFTSVTATSAPASASPNAKPFPIFLLAPTTNAFFPSKEKLLNDISN